jgi:hypothetical protein
MHTADAVLSGGVRRSACMIVFDENDEDVKEMIEEGLTPLSHKTFFTHNDIEY